MSTALKYWDSTAGQWVAFDNIPLPHSSIIVKGFPTGLINGTNTVFTTPQPYIAGSLQVYINGLAQSQLVAETTPTSGTFTVTPAPLTGDVINVYYHVANTAVGNADALGGYSLTGLLQALYPIGSVFVSGQNTMPAIVASIGTWVALEGRVIVGKSSAGTFSTVNATGGAETHTLTAAEIPSHSHTMSAWVGNEQVGATNLDDIVGSGNRNTTDQVPIGSGSTGNTGSGGAHNNLQPYKVKYMWERTA